MLIWKALYQLSCLPALNKTLSGYTVMFGDHKDFILEGHMGWSCVVDEDVATGKVQTDIL